jgi:uncharacterized RDD family membrane protein YckC
MNWYYAEAGQQVGPLSDVDFDGLVQAGKVRPDTLVWHEGLANWQPLRLVRPSGGPAGPGAIGPSPSGPAPAPTGAEVVCVECNGIFAQDQAVQYGGVWVCGNCKPLFLQKLREGAAPVPAGSLVYAGFWIRFAAKFLDGLILGVVLVLPLVLVLVMTGAFRTLGRRGDAGFAVFQVVFQLAAILVAVAYNTFFQGKFGATPGKMAVGVRVVTAEGAPITYGRAFGRAWAEQLSGMICYIGYIIAAFDREKRTLHDHICSTRVVRK